jgi:hypothetical protein
MRISMLIFELRRFWWRLTAIDPYDVASIVGRLFCLVMIASCFMVGMFLAQAPVMDPVWWARLDHEGRISFLLMEGVMAIGMYEFAIILLIRSPRTRRRSTAKPLQ